jgi:hypothetical protein
MAQTAVPACPIGKCVRFSGAPFTAASDILPLGVGYRVSMSSRGELCYTSGSASTPVAEWVLFAPRLGRAVGVQSLTSAAEAWDIAVNCIVGSAAVGGSAARTAAAWDLSVATASTLPLASPQPLPSGGVDPSALVGVAESAAPTRVAGWASTPCADSADSPTDPHATSGWFPAVVAGSPDWLQEVDGDNCDPADRPRRSSEARHTNLLGFPAGRLFGSVSVQDPCVEPVSTGPYELPFVDAVRWDATLPGVPGLAQPLARLQQPNGARGERTSELGVVAGWAGHTPSGACGQSGPIPRFVHAVIWNAPAFGGTVDLHSATLPAGTSSVAAAVEETVAPNLGLTVGGQRDGSTAVIWRQCDSWIVVDVADLLLDGGEPPVTAPFSSPPAAAPVTVLVSKQRSTGYQVVTDIHTSAPFAGYRDSQPFVATIFEDLNSDLRVDATDLAVLMAAFGGTAQTTASHWDTRDLDQDGVIGILDVTRLLAAHSGRAVVKLPDICACDRPTPEFRVGLQDALIVDGFATVDEFRSWLLEAIVREPLVAEVQVTALCDRMFDGGQS